MSADGSVLVGNASGTGFRWTQESGAVLLGTFDNYAITDVAGVSADGRVVIGKSSAPPHEAFRWTQETGMEGLGFPTGGTETEADAASGDGSVIVGRAIVSNNLAAFIWDRQHGSRLLAESLSNDHALSLTDWYLTEATAVTPDGLTITGYGRHENRFEGWMLHLPEPTTALLFASASLSLFRRQRRSIHSR